MERLQNTFLGVQLTPFMRWKERKVAVDLIPKACSELNLWSLAPSSGETFYYSFIDVYKM